MRLRERYRRLTFWNKVTLWGSLASILGVAATIWSYCLPLTSPLDRAGPDRRSGDYAQRTVTPEVSSPEKAVRQRGTLEHAGPGHRSRDYAQRTVMPEVSSPEEVVKQGDTFLYNRQFRQALDSYSMALTIDPRDSSIWRKKGISYIGLATGTVDFRRAIDNCADFDLKYFNQAVPCLEKAVGLDPKDKEACLYLGLAYYRWGNLHPLLGPPNSTQDAYSQFDTAANLRLEQHNISVDKWAYETSCAYYGIALVMTRLSRAMGPAEAEKARALLRKAVDTVPSCVPPDVTFEQLVFLTRKLPPSADPSAPVK